MNVLPDADYERFLGTQESQYIRPVRDFADEVAERLELGVQQYGDPLPWAKTHDMLRFRAGEVTIWAGIGGSGKSLLTGQVALHLIQLGRRCLIASLEMEPAATLSRMMRQAGGEARPSREFQERFYCVSDKRLWIYDQVDTVRADRILGMIHYAATELGIQHLFFDSLVKAGIGTDNYDGQTKFFDRICWAAKTHKIHVHVVHHLRKGSDQYAIPSGWDTKGAGELRDLTDNLVLVWKNQKKIEARADGETVDASDPDCRLIVDKQRHGEFLGHVGLYFHHGSTQFIEQPLSNCVIPFRHG